MKKVIFYSKENCSLCDKGLAIIHELQEEFDFEYKVVDIYQNDELLEKFQIMIPVIEIEEEVVTYGILDKDSIRKRLL
ncbi:glutaredoxin family protein [Metabacillus halosaccharovorans]|uniref:glutaredoxin family protein n=1 Tax=Metabacillus halosaccharovorans TaxID=930124 RepID=UPI002040D73E|nr:glutaredoxin family protein [Metabacillus halosaccharovorans]MCM3443399.1 glutaredoxin family protein [Metabacillus halosaccharovorans]